MHCVITFLSHRGPPPEKNVAIFKLLDYGMGNILVACLIRTQMILNHQNNSEQFYMMHLINELCHELHDSKISAVGKVSSQYLAG